jgi:hypothetical protein
MGMALNEVTHERQGVLPPGVDMHHADLAGYVTSTLLPPIQIGVLISLRHSNNNNVIVLIAIENTYLVLF